MGDWPVADLSIGLTVVAARASSSLVGRAAAVAGACVSGACGVAAAVLPHDLRVELAGTADRLTEIGRAHREAVTAESSARIGDVAAQVTSSDLTRDLLVMAVEDSIEDIMAVVMPAVMVAMEDPEFKAYLAESLKEMQMSTLPEVMEAVVPTSVVRMTTRAPADLVPLLRAAARWDR